jgi:hypothetical protein
MCDDAAMLRINVHVEVLSDRYICAGSVSEFHRPVDVVCVGSCTAIGMTALQGRPIPARANGDNKSSPVTLSCHWAKTAATYLGEEPPNCNALLLCSSGHSLQQGDKARLPIGAENSDDSWPVSGAQCPPNDNWAPIVRARNAARG